MRLSVTDRCNLACVYCVNHKRQASIPHDRVLRYEEFLRLAAIGCKLGVQKVRVTGGEPFARRGLTMFLQALREQLPDLRVCITTNATLLAPYLKEIPALGISSFNISLDSFRRDVFARLTGKDLLPQVLANIERLLAIGQRVKINAVGLRGIADAQMADFLRFVFQYPVDVRFIEFMPMGSNTFWNRDSFISWKDLLEIARKQAALREVETPPDRLAGPARLFEVEGAKGRLGFISAISEHFCSICNRLRVTSEGAARSCLFYDREYRLDRMLRNPKIGDEQLARALRGIVRQKPFGHSLLKDRAGTAVATKQMVGIGG